MEYSLIHCYSDLNKGDCAIVLGTLTFLREMDQNSRIHLISTFSNSDIRYYTEHLITKNHAESLNASIFPEPYLKIGSKYYYNSFAKTLSFSFYFVRGILILAALKSQPILKALLSPQEFETIRVMKRSKMIISKGGSFLYTNNNARSTLNFFRMWYQLFLATRMNKNVVILGQSLGPYNDILSRMLIKWVLKNISKIYLREEFSKSYLQKIGIDTNSEKYKIIPDLAFLTGKNKFTNHKNPIRKIGLTARPYKFDDVNNQNTLWQNYIQTLVETCIWLIEYYQFEIILVPQVLSNMEIENDLYALDEIYNKFPPKYKNHITYMKKDYDPAELMNIYSGIDVLIATRLHSAIFAYSVGTIAIVIAYQGTKAQGILKMLDLEELLLDINSLSIKQIKQVLEYILQSRKDIIHRISCSMEMINSEFESMKMNFNN